MSMSIQSGRLVRGCGLTGGLLIFLYLLSPTASLRLQSQQVQQSPSSKLSPSSNLSQNKGEASWPPRIPLWGFLPSSTASTHKNSIINSNANLNSNSAIAKAPKSKRDSNKDPHNHQGLSYKYNFLESALPPDSQGIIDEDDLGLDEEWLHNLERSAVTSSKRGHEIPHGMSHPGTHGTLKRNRMYDVPQIECPPAEDGMERFACPTPDNLGRYPCVDDHVLCDGFVDCPGREDEDRQACMFYKTTKAHLDVLADALLRWARGKRR